MDVWGESDWGCRYCISGGWASPSDYQRYSTSIYSFLPNKIESLTYCMSENSVTSAHKRVGGCGIRWARVTLQN